MNPAEASKRAAIAEAWKGTGAKVAVQTYILGKCKRSARRIERVFASGVGSTANPATLGYEGEVTPEIFIEV